MQVSEERIAELVAAVGENFNCFGGDRGSKWNPIAEAMKGKPLAFAGMVSVEQVVRFIAEQLTEGAS